MHPSSTRATSVPSSQTLPPSVASAAYAMATSSDHNVTETALDAVKCKLSAVTLGYFRDDFLTHFVPKPTRRIPLIHRGYYLRHVAIADCVDRFLAHATATASSRSTPVQIVSLGAGFDTLFFRLMQQQPQLHLRFVEIDCDAIVDAKRAILDAKLAQLLPAPHATATRRSTADELAFECTVDANQSSYALGASDLGDTRRLASLLASAGIDFEAPTLVLAECVVSYLEPMAGTALLTWLAASFQDATAVLYDPLALNDAFGETLQHYFAVKGCELLSLRRFQTPQDHCDRLLRQSAWRTCRIVDMNAVFDAATSPDEKARVQALEAFDEYADWAICNAHYGLFLATTQTVSSTHWSQQFCAARGFLAQCLSHDHDDHTKTTVLRTFQRDDLQSVQKLFQSTHLDYACKAVTKFVNNRVRSGDLADVEASFFAHTGSHFWVVETMETMPNTATNNDAASAPQRAIIGCIGLKPHATSSTTAELCRLSVATTARRRGLARRLVETLEAFAVQRGYATVHLDTIESMAAAQAFYRANEYVEAAQRTKFSTFTLVSFSKTL